jgi:hypothetical protein
MLRTSQRYLHALHDSRIVWVGNPLISPAIFGNLPRSGQLTADALHRLTLRLQLRPRKASQRAAQPFALQAPHPTRLAAITHPIKTFARTPTKTRIVDGASRIAQ